MPYIIRKLNKHTHVVKTIENRSLYPHEVIINEKDLYRLNTTPLSVRNELLMNMYNHYKKLNESGKIYVIRRLFKDNRVQYELDTISTKKLYHNESLINIHQFKYVSKLLDSAIYQYQQQVMEKIFNEYDSLKRIVNNTNDILNLF